MLPFLAFFEPLHFPDWHGPCPEASPFVPYGFSLNLQLHRILLGAISIVKYRHVFGPGFSLLLIDLIAKPFRKLVLHNQCTDITLYGYKINDMWQFLHKTFSLGLGQE